MRGEGVDEGANHADAGITGSTATQSYDDVAGTALHGIGHQLAHAIAGGEQRVALVGAEQGEPASLSHLDDCCVALQQVVG